MAMDPTDKWRGILGGLAEEIGAAEDSTGVAREPVRAVRARRRRFFVRTLDEEPADIETERREGG